MCHLGGGGEMAIGELQFEVEGDGEQDEALPFERLSPRTLEVIESLKNS